MINNLTKLTLSLSCALLLTYHQAQAAPQNKTATISASVAKSESTTGFDQAINFGTLTPNASGTTKTTESAVNFTSNSGTNYFITVEMTDPSDGTALSTLGKNGPPLSVTYNPCNNGTAINLSSQPTTITPPVACNEDGSLDYITGQTPSGITHGDYETTVNYTFTAA